MPEIEKAIDESMMPSLVVEAIEEISVEPFIVATDENTANPVVFFEISTGADQAPVIEFDIPTSVAPVEKKKANGDTPPTEFISEQKEANTITPSAARYLEKPANIYVSETPRSVAPIPAEDILPSVDDAIEDEHSLVAMHMVIKDEFSMDEEKQHEQSSQSILMARVEEQPVLDETEELRRRATDRIAKLRNLSFNINAADPNNEFETVPAYLRRNMELHNSIADVESFYSNYTVKGDESNVIEPGINTFLDGKKPD